jgi:hypothetical protein
MLLYLLEKYVCNKSCLDEEKFYSKEEVLITDNYLIGGTIHKSCYLIKKDGSKKLVDHIIAKH